ncbi:GAF domain-containing sensor histidine kinase [Ktedonosporobacter rubrisoli]|uniref:histidine kinase n=2 Tax=Ktedonosporobacter rubrisoli TaxID=2509675 RepID=A0A4P6K3K2_KTERU|nr:GAF domain-containing sensor histidine kinase [Ktedonosporobacter rubrisoli]QBD82724.1 GAF domain-containing sensor histidine kinase [Ktedonosporobacter rubrisoli]
MLHAAEEISGITDITDILHRLLVMMMSTLNCARGVVEIFDQEEHIFNPLLSIGLSDKEEEQWLEDQKRWLEPSGEHYAGFREQLVNGYTTLVSAEQCPEEADEFLNTMILAVPITHNSRLLGAMVLDRTSAPHVGGATAALLPEPTAFNVWDIAVAEGIAQFAGLALEQARWQQEAEIARNNEAIMRESNALKDEFLAITAHEFRTPLTVILAHSQMIARTLRKAAELDPGLRDKLNESSTIIGLQAHQLTNIVNTFLEVTRLNRGQISLTLEEINLVEIVKQAVAAQSTTSTQHEISYVIEPAEHPYLVYGDRARLLQIFANLLQNAIKYSPFGGPITVSLAQRPGEDGSMIIEACVTDKGIGVPPEAQEHLFERFYRASNTELSKTRGVGLGLYVVAELLRLHNGTIHVESSGLAGEGSRFVLTLPLAEGQIHH